MWRGPLFNSRVAGRLARIKGPRRFRRGQARLRLVVGLLLLATGLLFLPTIVAKTPLSDVVLGRILPSDRFRLSVSGLSLGWFSPPAVAGLKIADSAGMTLLTAESIRASRNLLALLANHRDLGTVEIVRPILYVAVRPDGSNLEDLVAQLVESRRGDATLGPASDAPVGVAINVVEGAVLMREMATGREWRIEQANVQYASSAGGSARLSATGRVEAADGASGSFAIGLAPDRTGRQQLTWEASSLPLSAIEPWLGRIAHGAQLTGGLSGQAAATWSPTPAAFPNDFTTTGQLQIERLDATAAELNGDRVRLARMELPWRLVADPRGLAVEELAIRSDVGQFAMRGILDASAIRGGAWSAASARHDLEVRGTLDVAQLTAMLPRALRIRTGTTVTSGVVQLAARQQPTGGGQTLSGTLRTTEFVATSSRGPIHWDQPLSASATLTRQEGGLRLDALKCDSEFLKIDAAAAPEQVTARADFDLNKLADQLGQFIDLSGIELAGTGTAQIDWQPRAGDQFSTTATAELAQLRVTLPDGAVWSEPQLTARADAAGRLDPLTRRPTRLDTGQMQLTGQGDELSARLMMPVELTTPSPEYPLSLRATGNVARWLIRARPWFAPRDWRLDGQGDLSATVGVSAQAVEATDSKLVLTNFDAASPGWTIREPRVELSLDELRRDGASGRLAANDVQLITSTISLAAKDVQFRTSEGRLTELAGTAAFRADLARLAAWQEASPSATAWRPAGMVTGNLKFAQQVDRIIGELTATGKNMVLSEWQAATAGQPAGSKTRWLEPELTIHGATDYQSTADRLTLRQLQIQSSTLQAAIDGQVDQLTTAANVNLRGTLNYDLAQVSQLVAPFTGGGIQLTGREQARFTIAAVPGAQSGVPQSTMHWSRRMQGQAELPWSAANVYGLPVGAGRISAMLGEGLVRVEPLALSVGEGQLTAAPLVRLDPQPAELSLPAGPVVTGVQISPEVAEKMLKYVAPVLAGATRCEGRFSLQLSGGRVPLAEPRKADIAGQMTVHAVQVVPGPLAQQWVTLAQQIESLAKRRDPAALATRPPLTLLAIRDQQVNFRVIDGRVYHQGMEFQAGDVVLRSQGSVGLDETLAITLFVPIQDGWVEREPLLAGLKGQSLQIPISGTLSRPRMDERAVANLSQQLLQNAAGQAIGNELNKALDKLFKPR